MLKPRTAEWMRDIRYSVASRPDLQCSAKSKQSGQRCRRCVARGWTVCHIHGAGGRNPAKGKRNQPLPPKNERNLSNRTVKLGRKLAQQEAETVPPEVLKEFARNWADRVAPADQDRFLILLHRRMLGGLSAAAWRDAQRVVVGLLE